MSTTFAGRSRRANVASFVGSIAAAVRVPSDERDRRDGVVRGGVTPSSRSTSRTPGVVASKLGGEVSGFARTVRDMVMIDCAAGMIITPWVT
ncbi:hypothetical protein [Nannocystis pusilla]|uniref:Uncharacterized protein n=1 Tax=Nannocystis pusilla TaxID=889268 RepID=A0ABS7TKJ6_9BACT|nr:hypothetical protein [Nannocystis pusilla]MBZ5708742.1 hypothetical protein [Nannocystis pusilla]